MLHFPLPIALRRHLANKALMRAVDRHDTRAARHALENGADPNCEIFHARWQATTGIRFGVRQWWGGKRNEPIRGAIEKNYWRTPLACAVEKEDVETINVLLGAGANPWSNGNGHHGWARPSPIQMVLSRSPDRFWLASLLDDHLDHVARSAASIHVRAPAMIEALDEVASKDRYAAAFIRKLRARIDSVDLDQDTVQPSPPSTLHPVPRF